jgi:translation elongation factor EF-4
VEYRNIAIISHVDHGKTTLVDGLLQQTLKLGHGQEISERAMDNNVLEKERGIHRSYGAVIWRPWGSGAGCRLRGPRRSRRWPW